MLGKVIVVTGAGSGLGEAVCLLAAERGATVVLVDTNEGNLARVSEKVAEKNASYKAFLLNVCDKEAVERAVEDVVNTFGHVDGLVNCAGIFSSIPFLELSENDWDKMINVNLKGSFLCAQAFIRHAIKQSSGGSIVFISSISGYVGFTKSAHYCASKGAVRLLSKCIALEFAPNGIRSNVIAPGTVDTPMNAWICDDEVMRAQSLSSIPQGRFGKPSEVAEAILFLLSDNASFCNGSELLVDGAQITHC